MSKYESVYNNPKPHSENWCYEIFRDVDTVHCPLGWDKVAQVTLSWVLSLSESLSHPLLVCEYCKSES